MRRMFGWPVLWGRKKETPEEKIEGVADSFITLLIEGLNSQTEKRLALEESLQGLYEVVFGGEDEARDYSSRPLAQRLREVRDSFNKKHPMLEARIAELESRHKEDEKRQQRIVDRLALLDLKTCALPPLTGSRRIVASPAKPRRTRAKAKKKRLGRK